MTNTNQKPAGHTTGRIFRTSLVIMAIAVALALGAWIYSGKSTATTPFETVLHERLVDYGWPDADVAAVDAAYAAGDYDLVTVKVTPSNVVTLNGSRLQLWGTPYGKRWSEGNMLFGHIRDEFVDGETEVVRITLDDRRVFVLMNECNDIEKISVGIMPVVRASRPPAPPVQTPAPDPYRVRCGTCSGNN